jgi:hypothetical protein
MTRGFLLFTISPRFASLDFSRHLRENRTAKLDKKVLPSSGVYLESFPNCFLVIFKGTRSPWPKNVEHEESDRNMTVGRFEKKEF